MCGNGGSASDATHLATEFLCRFCDDRRPYPAISLTANGEFMTAVCNDYHADEIFARQVWGLGERGDLLIAFTTSGKSRNVLRALEEANRKKMKSICFLGRDGGFTKGVATLDLLVPGTNTARIQEAQNAAIPRPVRDGGSQTAEVTVHSAFLGHANFSAPTGTASSPSAANATFGPRSESLHRKAPQRRPRPPSAAARQHPTGRRQGL